MTLLSFSIISLLVPLFFGDLIDAGLIVRKWQTRRLLSRTPYYANRQGTSFQFGKVEVNYKSGAQGDDGIHINNRHKNSVLTLDIFNPSPDFTQQEMAHTEDKVNAGASRIFQIKDTFTVILCLNYHKTGKNPGATDTLPLHTLVNAYLRGASEKMPSFRNHADWCVVLEPKTAPAAKMKSLIRSRLHSRHRRSRQNVSSEDNKSKFYGLKSVFDAREPLALRIKDIQQHVTMDGLNVFVGNDHRIHVTVTGSSSVKETEFGIYVATPTIFGQPKLRMSKISTQDIDGVRLFPKDYVLIAWPHAGKQLEPTLLDDLFRVALDADARRTPNQHCFFILFSVEKLPRSFDDDSLISERRPTNGSSDLDGALVDLEGSSSGQLKAGSVTDITDGISSVRLQDSPASDRSSSSGKRRRSQSLTFNDLFARFRRASLYEEPDLFHSNSDFLKRRNAVFETASEPGKDSFSS